METLQTAITTGGDTGSLKKPLIDDKKRYNGNQSDESNYVDLDDLLDMKSDGTKTVKVTFTGEGNQLAIFKCKTDTSSSGDKSTKDREVCDNVTKIFSEDCQDTKHAEKSYSGHALGSRGSNENEFTSGDTERKTSTDPHNDNLLGDEHSQTFGEPEELQYTDMYLNSRCESEDDINVVLTDQSAVDTSADESHYITTHEIQLTELDHDVDYEIGRGSYWDFEDDNLVYSFVDYASFDSDYTEGTDVTDRNEGQSKSNKAPSISATQQPSTEAAESTEHESDLCDSDKCASSDESVSKPQNDSGNTPGKIHLSIKTSSRAINDSSNVLGNEDICYHARRIGERSRYCFKSTGTRGETSFDRGHYFIPAPDRQHLASKLKGKDINEYSSGASSSVSELDDADKEVRNLTARSFRSLACPYFDAINLSTSSESSMSEHGLGFNKWSAFVDLNYGNMTHGRDRNRIAHKSSTSTFEVNKSTGYRSTHGKPIAHLKGPQTRVFASKNKANRFSSQQGSSASKKIEIRRQMEQGRNDTITLTNTLSFNCNVEAELPVRESRTKCVENASGLRSMDEATGITPNKPGGEATIRHGDMGETVEDTHKKAIFASSLLKNVISKKMQFEQERKMERGEIRDTYPVTSPSFQSKDQDVQKDKVTGKGLQRQTSETGSGLSIISLDELGDAVDSGSRDSKGGQRENSPAPAVDHATELSCDAEINAEIDTSDTKKTPLPRSQNSAFKSWKEGEEDVKTEPQSDTKTESLTEKSVTNKPGDMGHVRNKLTMMSHLYVPSSQLLPKEKELTEETLHNESETSELAGSGEGGARNVNFGEAPHAQDTPKSAQASKAPEIKIHLRSVKDNKTNPFNIANLLTPNIGHNASVKLSGEPKSHFLSVSDKVPHFMVRDIRDNKCKFQTPIHQVRDVRKLVKSSYRVVALENSEGKGAPGPSSTTTFTLPEGSKAVKKEPDKKPFTSPMVIKFQSVNTNNAAKQIVNMTEIPKQVQVVSDSDRLSPRQPKECARSQTMMVNRARIQCAKQPFTDQSEFELKIEARTAKHRPEKADITERKPESKLTNQVALEKLQAAVKSMEQLYVFDRNEWKRKTEPPRPITDSHVLSLITREEQGVTAKPEFEDDTERSFASDKCTGAQLNTEKAFANLAVSEDTRCSKPTPVTQEKTHIPIPKPLSHQSGTYNNKCVFKIGNSLRAPVNVSHDSNSAGQTSTSLEASTSTNINASKSPGAPLSLKISQPKWGCDDRAKPKNSLSENPLEQPNKSAPEDSENYLTIPVKACASEYKPASVSIKAPVSLTAGPNHSAKAKQRETSQKSLKRSPIVMESWSPESSAATIYHHPLPMAVHNTQPQVLCFSPPAPALPSDSLQQTQKKMLLDPTTGHYYLVDTPVQPASRRLYDPETGQYVEVPLPVPSQPLTPVPLSVSPLAISPGGAYGPTYMIYPGVLPPSTSVPPHSHSSTYSEGDEVSEGAKVKEPCTGSAYASQQTTSAPVGHTGVRGPSGPAGGKPVISITSQQGPRIVAPPSFDGTTMSFVVEHR